MKHDKLYLKNERPLSISKYYLIIYSVLVPYEESWKDIKK